MRTFDLTKSASEGDVFRRLTLFETAARPGDVIRVDGARPAARTFLALRPLAWDTVVGGVRCRARGRVVSLALFGDHRMMDEHWRDMPDYVRCFVLAHRALFPGYDLVIHHDDAIYRASCGDELHGLARRGILRLRYMDRAPKCLSMLWRFRPAWDQGVTSVWCRDLDSIPTWLDRRVVEEAGAIMDAGEADLHTWSADPMHTGMMGGLCGFSAAALRDLYPSWDDFIAAARAWGDDPKWDIHGADQAFLNEVLAPQLRTVEHRTFRVKNDSGEDVIPEATIPNARLITSAADYDDPEVPVPVRAPADGFTNYPGAAGYRITQALSHYTCTSLNSAFTFAETGINQRLRPVLSCDRNVAYAVYLPIVCLAWRRRLGAHPLVLLIGNATDWLADPSLAIVLSRTRETGAEIWFVPEPSTGRTCTVAQMVRIYAAAVPTLSDDDVLLTTDADMLPIGDWICQGWDTHNLTIRYANAYASEVRETGRPHWPMCYISGTVKTWREVTGVDDLVVSLSRGLAGCPDDDTEAWGYDERFLSDLIAKHPEMVHLVDRSFTQGEWRLDRSGWEQGMAEVVSRGSLHGVADAHMPLPGHMNWDRVLPLFRLAFSNEDITWVEDYIREVRT